MAKMMILVVEAMVIMPTTPTRLTMSTNGMVAETMSTNGDGDDDVFLIDAIHIR